MFLPHHYSALREEQQNVIKKALAVFSCRAHLQLQRIVQTEGKGIKYEHKTWQLFTYSWRLRAPLHRELSLAVMQRANIPTETREASSSTRAFGAWGTVLAQAV